jgi:hypothetical protein
MEAVRYSKTYVNSYQTTTLWTSNMTVIDQEPKEANSTVKGHQEDREIHKHETCLNFKAECAFCTAEYGCVKGVAGRAKRTLNPKRKRDTNFAQSP